MSLRPYSRIVPTRLAIAVLAAALVMGVAAPARAAFIITVNSVATTSTTGFFDVTLVSDTAFNLGGFSVGLDAAPGLTLTTATTATAAPYVFAGTSLFGPNIASAVAGADLGAVDFTTVLAGVNLAANTTYGLAHFGYTASGPGTFSVALIGFPGTGLSNGAGDDYPSTSVTLRGGTVTVTPTAVVPEPGSIALMGAGLIGVAGFAARRRCAA